MVGSYLSLFQIVVALKSVAYVFCVFEWIGGSGSGGSRFGRKIRPDQRCKVSILFNRLVLCAIYPNV